MRTIRQPTTEYELKRMVQWVNTDDVTRAFLLESAKKVNITYDRWCNWMNFNIDEYLMHGNILVCYRRGVPVGFLLMRVIHSVFDPKLRTLYQDLLYAEPGTRAAKYLLREFIDFGKGNADHIMTMIGSHTNIKASSLERLGFEKIEEVYSMET